MWSTIRAQVSRFQNPGKIALSVSIAVIAGNFLGVFNLLEWALRDSFFQVRPQEAVDTRIVVVTIDEPDIQAVGDWPIPDQVLADLLKIFALKILGSLALISTVIYRRNQVIKHW
jgi:CHASE2 domain-containing sensor protein